jgi:hypothetical protein
VCESDGAFSFDMIATRTLCRFLATELSADHACVARRPVIARLIIHAFLRSHHTPRDDSYSSKAVVPRTLLFAVRVDRVESGDGIVIGVVCRLMWRDVQLTRIAGAIHLLNV